MNTYIHTYIYIHMLYKGWNDDELNVSSAGSILHQSPFGTTAKTDLPPTWGDHHIMSYCPIFLVDPKDMGPLLATIEVLHSTPMSILNMALLSLAVMVMYRPQELPILS